MIKRVKYVRSMEGVLYCGRGFRKNHLLNSQIGEHGWLGNPFNVGHGRETCIAMYAKALQAKLENDKAFAEAFYALRGKVDTVACWCGEHEACHADVIRVLLDPL